MKERDWVRFLQDQWETHNRALLTLTELAHAARTTRASAKVQLGRLIERGLVTRFARGLYGLHKEIAPEMVLREMDGLAYVTGAYALHQLGLITQAPVEVTCFTRQQHRQRIHVTSRWRLRFVLVRPPVYRPPRSTSLPPAEQVLCDYLFLCRRRGIVSDQAVTWRNLRSLRPAALRRIAQHYPATVQRDAVALLAHGATRAH